MLEDQRCCNYTDENQQHVKLSCASHELHGKDFDNTYGYWSSTVPSGRNTVDNPFTQRVGSF